MAVGGDAEKFRLPALPADDELMAMGTEGVALLEIEGWRPKINELQAFFLADFDGYVKP